MYSTRTLSHTAIWITALLPGLVALGFLSDADFSSASSCLNTLGQLAGIWGLALLLVATMLCCRVPGFDVPFGGLTKLWKLHHRLGSLAFILLLAHPILLAPGAAGISLQASAATLLSTQSAIIWGWVALLALMAFMAPTMSFFGEPKYQRWKLIHRIAGITVTFALIHTLMLNRALPGHWSTIIWGLLTLLALAAISYRWLFSLWHARQPYVVSKVEHPANNVVELSLEARERPLKYQAGQFVYLTPHDPALADGVGEEHPYTLSSSPLEKELRIAIKALGNASRALQNITVGGKVTIEGPYGAFFPAPGQPHEPELWIAGGIGISPFMARIRHYAHRQEPLDVRLVYCVQDESRLLFGDELKSLFAKVPGSRLHVHYYYRQGPLTADFLASCCPDLGVRTAYVCGPTPLMDLTERLLKQAGVGPAKIVTEEFELL